MGRSLRIWSWILLACLLSACERQKLSFDTDAYFAHLQLDSTTLVVSEIAQNLSVPWDLEMGPDGWIWFTEQRGRVSIVRLPSLYYGQKG